MKRIITSLSLFVSAACMCQNSSTVKIYFDFDSFRSNAAGEASIDSLNAVLKNEKNYRLEVRGYCDQLGSNAYNQKLSVNRAAWVTSRLVFNGIDTSSIILLEGYGKRKLVTGDYSPDKRQLNRRVEITITRQAASVTLKDQINNAVDSTANIVLKNINFEGGLNVFLQSSYPALKELLDAMKTYPSLIIRIEGHICCLADNSDGPNMATGENNLSEARAKAVMDYLIENGIDASRLSSKGYGHSRPIYPYPEQNEEERIANRRVEIKILHK